MKYASKTHVPVQQSRGEIERVLSRYGARSFVSGWDNERRIAMVGFVVGPNGAERQVRLRLPLPDRKKYRTDEQAAQAERSAWRALLLVIKAKLEAVESGISTIEREFLADVVLPDGRTLGEWVAPQVEVAYRDGKMPLLLSEGGGR